MNTKKAIEHLKKNGFSVHIVYKLTKVDGIEVNYWTPSEISGKFLLGGITECIIFKEFVDKNKVITYEVSGTARCNVDDGDLFIPRIGRAIAFENAVKKFPVAKKCLEVAGLYLKYKENNV